MEQKNNPFTLKNFKKQKNYNETSISVFKDGIFKDFAHFRIKGENYAILLNSDIVKNFANYTLTYEMFSDDRNFVDNKGFGLVARYNPTDPLPKHSKHLACYFTFSNGVQMLSNNKEFTSVHTRTCSDEEFKKLNTLAKFDTRANFKTPLSSGWCFYVPQDADFVFQCKNNQEFEYIALKFNTNIKIPDFAYKMSFHFKNDRIFFQNLLMEENEFGRIGKCFELIKILSETTKNSPFVGESLSRRVVFLIQDTPWNFLADLSAESVAEQIAVSHSHLCAVFKKETGITLQDYIIDTKLNIALKMLKTFEQGFEKTSNLLGYSSYKTFARAFKKKFSATPKEYVKKP